MERYSWPLDLRFRTPAAAVWHAPSYEEHSDCESRSDQSAKVATWDNSPCHFPIISLKKFEIAKIAISGG